MSKLSLYVADADLDCVHSLVDYFTYFERDYFYKAKGFYKSDELEEVMKIEPPDILLITPEMFSENENLKNPSVTILLDDGTLPYGFDNCAHINKFKQGRDISSYIMSTYAKISQKSIISTNGGNTTITSVYSPIGGVGKTSVAIGLAKAFAESGEKTLYINLEDTPSTNFYFESEEQKRYSFSDVLYEMIKSNPNFSTALSTAQNISSDGVSFILPQGNSIELFEINQEQWISFMEQLHNINLYQRIVIDMSSSSDVKNFSVLSKCDHIVLLGDTRGTSIEKLKMFENYCNVISSKLFDYKNNLDKIYLVESKTDNRDESEKQKLSVFDKQSCCQIPFDKYLALYGRIDMTYKFGDSIRTIKKYLCEV